MASRFHLDLVRAVAARDAERARRAMRAHLEMEAHVRSREE